MTKQTLTAQKRTIAGRKVKRLRRDGVVPAVIYGKKIKSKNIQLDRKAFTDVFAQAGETSVIELSLDKQTYPVLIKNIHEHPVTREVLHVDLHNIDLTQKVTATIPLEVVEEAPAVAQKKGVLLTQLDSVAVEALPDKLPEHISVNTESLAEVGDTITVGQLSVPSGVTVLTDRELVVVKIGELVTKEAEEQAEAEELAAAEASAEGEEKAAEQPLEETPPTDEKAAEDKTPAKEKHD